MAKKEFTTENFDNTEEVYLYYDGDKYKYPLKVGVNGKVYSIPRGRNVRVPKEVAEVLRHSQTQDTRTNDLILNMQRKAKEMDM